MAYPFPRFASAPQTPQYLKGMESPSSARCRGLDKPKPHTTRWIVAFIGALALFLTIWLRSRVSRSHQLDRIPFSHTGLDDLFDHFEGRQDCDIASTDIYLPPLPRLSTDAKHTLYCPNRATLLAAMSGGGRHGFDAPYFPLGCHFRWYSTAEICMILDRFDSIVFLGDETLRHIYSAFNMLLRENIALGALRQWDMKESERETCRCANQLTRPECLAYSVSDSQSLRLNDAGSRHNSPYYCDRTPHVFIPIDRSPAPEDLHTSFSSILTRELDSYKPIPVIHSLSLATSLSWPTATSSMDEWVTLADISQKNVPFLWVGPNAAGHLKPPSQILSQGNNALWHYTIEMGKEAESRALDALGMYNLTLQAGSWDGSFYGQKVVLVQAMMIYSDLFAQLGKSGLKISKIILGAMSYGTPDWQGWVLNEEDSLPLLEHAYKVGLNTWDTADVYSNGRSEEIIAKALKQYNIPRSKVVILSKCYFGVVPSSQPPLSAMSKNDGDMVNQAGLSRKHIFDAVDASVARLGTYIDVLQIHRLDRDTPREEIMKALNDVVESGKVRYIGASSMAAWEFQSLQNIADRHGWHKFISMQNFHNLIYREEEREMLPYCADTGVGCIPWSPIARGVLARPWGDGSKTRETTDPFLKSMIRSGETDVDKAIVDRLEEVAKKKGVKMAQVATAWVLRRDMVNPIIGLASKERIDEAVAALQVKLTDEEAQYLEEPYLPRVVQGY
ncbi:MAG: hypothetical protein LQ345_003356 [Seirophora villosa]|nr:MAG: hypothetical protein LQ345_003356 [Seirophora villosa]